MQKTDLSNKFLTGTPWYYFYICISYNAIALEVYAETVSYQCASSKAFFYLLLEYHVVYPNNILLYTLQNYIRIHS